MEVRILHKFHDRDDFMKVYPVGETFTFDDSRAEYLVKLGLVEPVAAEEEVVEEVVEEPIEIVGDEEEAPEIAPEQAVEVEESKPAEENVVKPVAARRRNTPKDNL